MLVALGRIVLGFWDLAGSLGYSLPQHSCSYCRLRIRLPSISAVDAAVDAAALDASDMWSRDGSDSSVSAREAEAACIFPGYSIRVSRNGVI